jgi:branched-chain amino acid transport system permease protein
MNIIFQWLVTGLCVGLVLALFSVGYCIMFSVMRCLNLAHAGVFMLCALLACNLSMLPLFGFAKHAVIIGGPILAGIIFNLIVNFLALRYLLSPGAKPGVIETGSFLSTLGALIIINSIGIEWSDGKALSFDFNYLNFRAVNLDGVILPVKYLVVGAAAIVALIVTQVVLRSSLGKMMLAVADNRFLATVMGVPVRRIEMLAMVIAGALAGLAGTMIAYLYGQATVGLSQSFLVKAIVIGIVAGQGSIIGAMLIALGVGIIEAATIQYFGSGWRDISLFILVLIVLSIRPQGIFTRMQRIAT